MGSEWNGNQEIPAHMSGEFPKVYLARHGETAWSLSRQATGRTDIPLTDRGERDAGERAQPDPDLMEWDYGAYEGRRTAEIQAERPGWSLFENGCPGGETLQAVSERADRVIETIRALGGNVLVFAHRDILRILTARWLRLRAVEARKFYLTTASLSILGYHHDLDEPVIRLWNAARA